jgi:hypothetical protein
MRCKLTAKPGQIESRIDPPHQVIFGDRVVKTKFVEQLTLVTLQTAHHGLTSPRFASTQRNHGSRTVSTDFCNKIFPQATSARLLDHPVGNRKHCWWNLDTQFLGRPKIDAEIELGWLLDRNIADIFSL